jgi:hypothetical protein
MVVAPTPFIFPIGPGNGTGGGNLALHCNNPYTHTTSLGTFTLQWACGSSTVQAGFQIAAGLLANCIGIVRESGLAVLVNGKKQQTNGEHVLGCPYPVGYQYHNSWVGLKIGDQLSGGDTMTWQVPGIGLQTLTLTYDFFLA